MFDWTHEELPQPTTDLDALKSNIDEFGYCLVKDAIAPDQLAVKEALAGTGAGRAGRRPRF